MFTDLTLWRALATVLAVVCFIGIVVWAWWGGRNRGFDEAARLPFADPNDPNEPESEIPRGKRDE